ncbi:hypothetical protein H2204_008436 [Knufia peltigerae]|uniref:LYR motif-containing protein Cup1-like N-terminal domain-containing protein n=1 Tax=Knufia peltigerae TaxID=1002370 RepID=A0AA38XZV9_9EURO|nr:hypothetical protein H2204_008436 [Knufia peltigerae]
MTTNPIHLYRSLLREATYLPLPQCRTFIKSHITTSFRRYLPKYSQNNHEEPKSRSGNSLTFDRRTKLLHRGRKFLSSLRRANEGYTAHVEKVMRMTYGRIGPRRYALLEPWLSIPVSRDDAQVSDQPFGSKSDPNNGTGAGIGPEGKTPSRQQTNQGKKSDNKPESTTLPVLSPRREAYFSSQLAKYDISPNMRALLVSQAAEQSKFDRSNRPSNKVKPSFKPSPPTTIWGTPLPPSRVKNLKREWYRANVVGAALPPLPGEEYKTLHDLVSGKTPFPAIPQRRLRRPRAQRSEELQNAEEADRQAEVILEGPKPGIRFKDYTDGRPHKMTPRLLRHLLSRSVLKQTPFVKLNTTPTATTSEPHGKNRPQNNNLLAFHWDDALTRERYETSKLTSPITQRQSDLLFAS